MADELHTVGIKVEADSSQAAKLTRALNELAQQMEKTAQNQQKLRTNMQQNQQQMQSGGAAAGYFMGQMKALAAQMLAMVGITVLVNKAFHEFSDAIKQAAKLQEASDNFVDIADNAQKAEKALKEIQKWWQGAGGVFKQEDIMDAANQLAGLHVKAEAIPTIIQKLGDAASTAGGSLRVWVENLGTFLSGKFIGQGSEEMKLLLEEVAEASGQSVEKIKQHLSKAKPDELIRMLELALNRMGTAASKTYDQAADAALRFDGQSQILESRWLFLKQQFALPIIDALSPMIKSWNEEMAGGGTRAKAWGDAVAGSLKNINAILTDETQDSSEKIQSFLMMAFKGLFDWLIFEVKTVWTFIFWTLPKAAYEKLSEWYIAASKVTWTDVGNAIVAAWDTVWEKIKEGAKATLDWFATHFKVSSFGIPYYETPPPAPAAPNQFLTGGQTQGPPMPLPLGLEPVPAFNMTADAVAKVAGAAGDVTGSLEHVVAGIRNLNETAAQATGDLKVMEDFWAEMADAWTNATTAASLQAAQLGAVAKAAKGLVDPISKVNELTKGMAPDTAVIAEWILYEEAAQRAIALTDLRMKAGVASMNESVSQGLKLMVRSWGTWQQQISQGIQEIGNALVSNISGGLKEILMGTKSVEEGFRDMALGIIQAIEDIILKMLIQLAIQQAIAALSGGTWFGGNLTQPAGPIRPAVAVGAQSGGRIGSGYGGGDRVPIMGEEGEFMVNKKSARHFGYDKLERINRMQEGGKVPAGGRGAGYIPQNQIPYFDPNTGQYFFGDPNFEPIPLNQNPLMHDPSWQNQVVSPNSIWAQLYGQNVTMGQVVQIITAGQTGGGGVDIGQLANPPSSIGDGSGGGGSGGSGGFDPRNSRTSQLVHALGLDKKDAANRGLSGLLGSLGKLLDTSSGNFSPAYLWSIGYRTGQGTGSLWPSGTGNRGYAQDDITSSLYDPQGPFAGSMAVGGVGGGGGSFFHQLQGVRGGPLAGSSSVMGGGSRAVAAALGGGHWQRRAGYVMRSMFHDPATDKYPAPDLAAAFMSSSYSKLLTGKGLAAPTMSGGNWAGTNISAAQHWANVFSSRGYIFPSSQGAGGVGGGAQGISRGAGQRRTFHEGGIVDAWSAMQSGGMIKANEGVFTPAQMASMQPAAAGNMNMINVSVTNVNGPTETKAEGSGLTDADARELARLISAVCDDRIMKQRHVGGALYIPRSQRGG